MKKYILNAIAIFTFATGLSSCGDSFLETGTIYNLYCHITGFFISLRADTLQGNKNHRELSHVLFAKINFSGNSRCV